MVCDENRSGRQKHLEDYHEVSGLPNPNSNPFKTEIQQDNGLRRLARNHSLSQRKI